MRTKSVTLYRIRVPFKRPVEHASARRAFSDNLLIHYVSEDGVEGWGETIAREYVTGDDTDGAMARLMEISPSAWNRSFTSGEDMLRFVDDVGIADANVARCAIDIALLDALARRANRPISTFLTSCWPELAEIRNPGPFPYSGPIGVDSAFQTLKTALKLRLYGVAAVKVKLTKDAAADRRRLKIARAVLGSKIDIRVDPNESWSLEHASAMTPVLRQLGITAVEQPFYKTQLSDAKTFSLREEIPIIFDESLCSEADAALLASTSIAMLFAVKLAKLGGFFSTLKVLNIASQCGIPAQISCQVGETAILSAAGRHLAVICPNLRYLEGSYDRFMLAANVIKGDISVGKGGRAPALTGAGLGILVDKSAVERLATHTHRLFPA